MVNLTIDLKLGRLEVEESESFSLLSVDRAADMIKAILDKAFYSGETICLEVKDAEGHFTEVNRWK